jgi:hypothetical protein
MVTRRRLENGTRLPFLGYFLYLSDRGREVHSILAAQLGIQLVDASAVAVKQSIFFEQRCHMPLLPRVSSVFHAHARAL